MDQPSAIAFCEQFAAGNYTEAGHAEFLAWLAHAPEAELDPVLDAWPEGVAEEKPAPQALVVKIEAALDEYSREQAPPSLYRRLPRRWAAAAAILILLAGAAWLLRTPREKAHIAAQPAAPPAHDVLPGGNKAILTLSGGKQIVLDSAANGLIAQQGGASVNKTSDGQLIYSRQNSYINDSSGHHDPSNRADSSHRSFSLRSGTERMNAQKNTLSTPRGGQYQLTLSDGTRVWLNAASSITYPTNFTDKDREVTITGEAYLEVAQNARQPFLVEVAGTVIRVLGTRFNVNAYSDEPSINTTLLEGRVRVEQGGSQVILDPGQQARVRRGNTAIRVEPAVDVDQTIAWKDGSFAFVKADLPTVMRELSRWYNVEVLYKGNIPERHFYGRLGRDLTLDQLLKLMAQLRIHYTIETGARGNQLIISP